MSRSLALGLVVSMLLASRSASADDLLRAGQDPDPDPEPQPRTQPQLQLQPQLQPRWHSHREREVDLAEAATGFGVIFAAVGGAAGGAGGLSTSTGVDEPDPFRGSNLRTSGMRPAGGFATELLVRLDDIRIGFGTTVAFGDGFTLSSNPLPPGFSARPGSALMVDVYGSFGRQLHFGPVMPYADLVIGGSIFQTNVRLHHTDLGFLGESKYDSLRFALGPRVGVSVPIKGPLFIDGGGRVDFFGFIRYTGYIGLGLFVGGR